MFRSTALQSNRFQLMVFGILAAVMLLTRSHALTHLIHVPSTALASYFVLGYFVRRFAGFIGLFALGYAIDVVSISLLGVSDFCYTPAYAMLIPAYATMWLAGRFAARMPERLQSLPAIAVLLVGATFVSHLFSSGGFYFLGGRFPDPTIEGFLPRIARYFPFSLMSSLMWSGVAVALWALLLTARPDLRREHSR
ncbi:hypothetical protein [Novosphingobium mangrovi (ex Huang et al. 2023)]|uniref:Cobalamin ABC transporter n=1 Tax=Novosphingobium mangrovi (ex Huang et al. 2023) TaxID=2976432 RepID=A0ABT2IA36_9SPHN|nr:hypothetical protein [Novosphingobium mangrovi (ex Huang et al. 2023)]MCT2401428.1 hypothetical protein [Novosphingobium mangrovi (ex Huang et al. 2023)]